LPAASVGSNPNDVVLNQVLSGSAMTTRSRVTLSVESSRRHVLAGRDDLGAGWRFDLGRELVDDEDADRSCEAILRCFRDARAAAWPTERVDGPPRRATDRRPARGRCLVTVRAVKMLALRGRPSSIVSTWRRPG
jgi:hypothetical protein